MRLIAYLALGAILGALQTGLSAQTAKARLYCESLYVLSGTEPGADYTLEFSGIEFGVNNELLPTSGDFDHGAYAYLNDELFGDYIPGTLYVSLPTDADVNKDGFPDFFDSTQDSSGSTQGEYSFQGMTSGTVVATWSRAKGSVSGTCTFRLRPNNVYNWKTFTHSFVIFEYRGVATYTPKTNSVTASVQLSQTGFPENTFSGPINMLKSATNKYNLLQLQATRWTNSAAQELEVLMNEYERDTRWPTNYYGWLEFQDGDLNTSEADYTLWTLTVDDLNDQDGDKIPDFSDDPLSPAVPPTLTITGRTNLVLKVTGTVGRSHVLESSGTLAAGSWSTVSTFTLTNSPQSIPLPWQGATNRFWRVYVK